MRVSGKGLTMELLPVSVGDLRDASGFVKSPVNQ